VAQGTVIQKHQGSSDIFGNYLASLVPFHASVSHAAVLPRSGGPGMHGFGVTPVNHAAVRVRGQPRGRPKAQSPAKPLPPPPHP
jgi:hypothetical protein